MRRCCGCGETKPLDHFYAKHYRCKPCFNARQKAWRAANPEKSRSYIKKWDTSNREARRWARLRRMYGLTPEAFAELLESQGGCCAICRTPEPSGRGYWHVDHDHSCCSGEESCGECVRGLLCSRCNQAIGLLGDDPDVIIRAADYVRGATRAELG